MHTYTSKLYWADNAKHQIVNTHHLNMYLITTCDPTIGEYISSLSIDLPTENFASAIHIQLTATEYDIFDWNKLGVRVYTFEDLLPHPFDTFTHTIEALNNCMSVELLDGTLMLGKNLRRDVKYDHSYLSSMTDDQILQHAISYNDTHMVRCGIDAQLLSRGKRIKLFKDGSIDKIVPISKPKVKVKVGLSKSELNTQKRRLQARFRHKLQKWIGSPDVEVNDWASSQNTDQMKNNKKFMKDVGWDINTLLEYEAECENVEMDNVLFSKTDPKDYPELVAWWDSIVVD